MLDRSSLLEVSKFKSRKVGAASHSGDAMRDGSCVNRITWAMAWPGEM